MVIDGEQDQRLQVSNCKNFQTHGVNPFLSIACELTTLCNIFKSTAFVVGHKSWDFTQAHAGSLYHLQPAKPYRWRYIYIYMCVSSIIHFAISDAGARRQARGFRLRIRSRIRI